MELIARVGEVITPVFLIVALGWLYGRRHRLDVSVLNRLVLDVMTPLLVYSALASRDFHLAEHGMLLAGGALLIMGSGLGGWLLARLTRTSPRTLVPVVMFNNCGNMGLPLALFAFGPAHCSRVRTRRGRAAGLCGASRRHRAHRARTDGQRCGAHGARLRCNWLAAHETVTRGATHLARAHCPPMA